MEVDPSTAARAAIRVLRDDVFGGLSSKKGDYRTSVLESSRVSSFGRDARGKRLNNGWKKTQKHTFIAAEMSTVDIPVKIAGKHLAF